MRKRFVSTAICGAVVVTFAVVLSALRCSSQEMTGPPTTGQALLGQVTSIQEGQMEGVLVSAKRLGSTITTTVVSDVAGRYTFPSSRLQPGDYAISVRAVGYDVDAPGPVQVSVNRSSKLDLRLRKTADLAAQLSNGEWLLSVPGTDEQKQSVLRGNCVYCHTLEPIIRSPHEAKQFTEVLHRMSGYAQGSTLLRPQRRPGNDREPSVAQRERMAKDAEYLSSINMSGRTGIDYSLKALPRPSGKGTQVLITTFDLPRSETLPHDVAVDSEGMVWYADFGSQYLGMLDPGTAKVVEYAIPVLKLGAPTGALDVRFDRDGNVWLATMYQGSVVKFDRRTQKFQAWGSPGYLERAEARIAMVALPDSKEPDSRIWLGGDKEYQLDTQSGQWRVINGASFYGVAASAANNAYGMQLGGENIIEVDAKTVTPRLYPTPTPDSGPRRGHMDSQDRLWFAESRGNKIGMFDTKSKQFKEWLIPTPWTNPYDAVLDADGYVWTGGMTTDRIVRLSTATDEMVEYLLPGISTNIRRVTVDNSTDPPNFWIGDNLGASIVRVEPLQ